MTALDLQEDIFERPFVWQEAHVHLRQRRGRLFHASRRRARLARLRTAIAVPISSSGRRAFAALLIPARGPRAAFTPIAASTAATPITRTATALLFAREIGVSGYR